MEVALRAAAALGLTAGATALLIWWSPTGLYLWMKVAHVIAIIAWMAGMLYLPRLFVYHSEAPPGSPQSETFKIMERRLLRAIMNPAMVASYLFGVWLLLIPGTELSTASVDEPKMPLQVTSGDLIRLPIGIVNATVDPLSAPELTIKSPGVRIGVDRELSVAEGHHIATHVHHELMHHIPHLHKVAIQIDPDDRIGEAKHLHSH